jgi:hypothetical protein
MRSTHKLFCCTLLALTVATARAQDPREDRAEPRGAQVRRAGVRRGGVELSYAELVMPGGRRTIARAEKLIRGLEARARTTVWIGHGRRALGPGEYVVTVEGKPGENHFLVFTSAGATKAPRRASPRRPIDKPEVREEDPEESNDDEPAEEDSAVTDRDGEWDETDGAPGEGADRFPQADDGEDQEAGPPPDRRARDAGDRGGTGRSRGPQTGKTARNGREREEALLRVPLRIAASPSGEGTDRLTVSLEDREGGARLRLTICAGNVEATANLRLGGAPKKSAEELPRKREPRGDGDPEAGGL